MRKRSSSEFGDIRLDVTYALLLTGMVTRYKSVLRKIGDSRNDEVRFGRFIQNPKVEPKTLLTHHWNLSDLIFKGKHLLIINDSSKISFLANTNRTDLGYVGPKTTKRGFDIHPSIIVDADDGAFYGLGGITIQKTEIIDTPEKKKAQKQQKNNNWKTPFTEKGSYKWFDSPNQAITNCSGAASYTLLGDRESDIYDVMTRAEERGWHYLFRSKTDRCLWAEHTEEQATKIRQAIAEWSIASTYELELNTTKKRTAHKATLDIKYGEVTIKRPYINMDKTIPETITLRVVEVKEQQSSVVGDEYPIHWILLTSHHVDQVSDAIQIVQWYCWRWIIEQLFRTIKKQGFKIESSQVETFHALKNLTAMALLAAVQVMQLVYARDGNTNQKLNEVFFEEERQCLEKLNKKMEGKTKKLLNPHPPDTLAFSTWIIARLGGWSGYQKDKPPGPITILNGLTRFYDILVGYYLLI